MKQHGDTVAGKKIEIIRKDTGGPTRTSPSASRRSWSCATRSTSSPASLLTPEALGAADVSAEAKKFMVS